MKPKEFLLPLLFAAWAGGAAMLAQEPQPTRGDVKPAFDITRFRTTPAGTFETFHVTETRPLGQALDAGTIKDDTRLLVTDTAGGKLALLTDQMAYHHIAQGREASRDWMATF